MGIICKLVGEIMSDKFHLVVSATYLPYTGRNFSEEVILDSLCEVIERGPKLHGDVSF